MGERLVALADESYQTGFVQENLRFMMPLRHIELDLDDLPELPKKGALMPLERAVVLVMLDPELKYFPIDIARIAYAHVTPGEQSDEIQKQIWNARRGYAQLAKSADMGSNPQLSGRQWVSLLRAGLRPIAALMAQLKQRQEAEPGVVFTLVDGQLVAHPQQDLALDPPLPPKRQHRYPKRRGKRALANTVPRLGSKRRPLKSPEPLLIQVEGHGGFEPDEAIPRQHEGDIISRRSRNGFSYLGTVATVLGALALGFILYWLAIDEIKLQDIQEIAEPAEDVAYVMARQKRYMVGDRLRFEGQVGRIREIHRERIVIGRNVYPAPKLFFFGAEITLTGNAVVYPGSPRHVAGNFWISRSGELDRLPRGYLSWVGDFKNIDFATADFCDVCAFWARVTGKPITCKGSKVVSVPANFQFEDFLDQCKLEGVLIQDHQDAVEVSWP